MGPKISRLGLHKLRSTDSTFRCPADVSEPDRWVSREQQVEEGKHEGNISVWTLDYK
jgi:hypothetical protein